MIEFFVKRPITTIMFVCVFVVLGIFTFSTLSIERTPKVDFPIITVSVEYPGATPLEVETLVVKKIEDAISELSEIDKIRSRSYDGFGYIFVEFLLSADVNVKSIEVKDKVEAILNELPEDIKKPVIEKFDPLVTPVLDLVLSSDTVDARDLYEFADKTLKTKLSSVEGVAKVDVYGGKERQINVRLDPMQMKQHYITIADVISAVQAKSTNIPGGQLEKDLNSLSVRFIGEFQSVDEIRNMILTSQDGSRFPLRAIATVEDSFKKIETIARYNGKDVVGLSINKVSEGNAADIAQEIRRRLGEFRGFLPDGMRLEIASDTTKFIVDETHDTEISILIGILLTVIILFLFTGQAKLTFISAIVIPTSLISTFFLMSASKFTINMMTLLAIATSLGTLIANAIVIIENVLVHLEHKETAVHAAIDGTKEVAGAVMAATGTNLVVFMPIAMMGGIVGQFMKSFGLTVVYATLFSLLASFTLTPMLCSLLLKKRDNKKHKAKGRILNSLHKSVEFIDALLEFLKRRYRYAFDLIFKFPKTTLLLLFVLLLSLRFIMPYIDNEFVSQTDEDKIKVGIVMPQGSTIGRTLEVCKIMERRIEKIPEKKSYLTSIGENGVENATITVDLVPSSKRKRSDADIIDELIPFTARIPDAEINLARVGMRDTSQGDVSINVYGINYEKMIKLAQLMKTTMEQSGYFRSVTSSYKTPKKEIQFIPDQNRLIQYGVTNSQVGSTVRSSIYGNTDNVYKERGEEYDINIELNDAYAMTADDIREITVRSTKGLIPITELGTLKNDIALPTIWHRDKGRVIRLEGYLAKSALGYVKKVLDKKFKDLPFEEGYGYTYVGDSEHQAETGREISKAFILAVILTYMLLSALLNSGMYSVPIMLSVVTSFIGVFMSLFFLGQSMNIASMLGMVMLVGIVVNNAILLLDYTMLKMKEGVPAKEALWLGATVKFRAIIMTSLAIILGVLPQLGSINPAKQSMGAVMIGGILASIVFTFIFTPVAFWYTERLRNFFVRTKSVAK